MGHPAGGHSKEVAFKEMRMKTRFRLSSSAWIRFQESNARQSTVGIFKVQYSLGESFQAAIVPIPGTVKLMV